ncbi:MFS transporter [Murimonas intestini]|uniref:MFS transporter n=1 Tax=Murimonas intestini TaxID=1337051 RepID=UPI0011DD1CCF|nr:MFS transporter [Murimonas intestini]
MSNITQPAGQENTNHAKLYQLALFPMNNGATNVYFVLVLSYIALFGNGVLGLLMAFATIMVTVMRLCDAITDPIIGALIDRTNGKFGKFRPFMVIGNLIMAASVLILYLFTPMIPDTMMWLRYVLFVLLYFVWVIGYTFQTSCTRSGQTVLTNDPKQRPMFTLFNTVGSLVGMGAMQFLAPLIRSSVGDYNTAAFYRVLAPLGIVISLVLTVLAVIGIWEKDQPKYFGIGGKESKKVKISEYIQIIKCNKPMQRLMVAGAGCKLALAIATNVSVLCMLYGSMMGNYDGLYLPMMVLGYVFSVPFFLLTIRTSQKHGQKASLEKYVRVALIMYIGVLALMILWKPDNPAFNLSLFGEGGLTINLYTVLFIVFFGVGYGAYYSTADMPIPMVADCSDYETYRSGQYIPGVMGTLFSLVDKLVSSLSTTVVALAISFIGLKTLPAAETAYEPGMNWVVIVLFCVIPMIAWIATLIAMKGYTLTGAKMKEIQTVNASRKAAIAEGKTLEEAMKMYPAIEDVKAGAK